jgi:flagellar motor switch protein FliG
MEPNKLAGAVKVAILVQAVGPKVGRIILDRFNDTQRNLIYKLQSQLGGVSSELAEKISQEFIEKATFQLSPPKDRTADKARKENASKEDSDDSPAKSSPTTLKALQSIEPDQLIQLIKDEHPQTIALIIVHLKPNLASEVLGRLPDEIKADVALRIANLDKVVSGMVEEIDKVFQDILQNKEQSVTQEAGGVERLAEILNQIDTASAEQIIDEIEEMDPDLADEIKANMFVFEDIVLVDDKGLQQVLRAVESQELAMALKAATDEVKEKIFSNMSERAAEILKEEMEVSGAVRMKDVTDAQQKITRIIQEMERKGELIISGRGGEEFVA